MSDILSLDTFTGAAATTGDPAAPTAAQLVNGVRAYILIRWPSAFTAGDVFQWNILMSNGVTYRLRARFTSATQVVFEVDDGTGFTNDGTHNQGVGIVFPIAGSYGHLSFRYTQGVSTTALAFGFRGRCPLTATDNDADFFSIAGVRTPTTSTFTSTVVGTQTPGVYGQDIEGRTPDGGGNSLYQVGAWAQQVPVRNGGTDSEGYFGVISSRLYHQAALDAVAFSWDEYLLAGIPALGSDYSVEAVLRFHNTSAVSARLVGRRSNGYGYELKLTNYSPAPSRAYKLELISRSSGAGATVLDTLTFGTTTPLNTDLTLRLCVSTAGGDVQLLGFLNGALEVDATDDGLGAAPAFTTGDPGLILEDVATGVCVLQGVSVSSFQVATSNGGTTPPPPPPSGDGALFVKQKAVWQTVPIPDGVTTDVTVFARGAQQVVQAAYVRKNGTWNLLKVDSDLVGDPGDNEPDIGCTDITSLPPPIPLEPLDRLFYCSQLPTALWGNGTKTPFNATTIAMTASFILNALALAATTGMILLGTQGGYTKFQTGGAYDPAKMDAFIDGFGAIESDLHDYFDLGNFYGVSIFDDFDSAPLWPPSGISNTEKKRVATRWKSVLPWVRTSIRGKPTQLVGESFAGYLDNCRAQFHYRAGGDPVAFRTDELAAAASIGVPSILWSLNWTKGGSTGGFMTPAQIETAGLVFCDAATEATGIENHGVGGWRYDGPQFVSAGTTDAFITLRNALLPPVVEGADTLVDSNSNVLVGATA